MKMLMIVYNEALDNEVMEILENCVMKNYTKVSQVFGRGASSGTHLGNDIWPGLNNILYVVCEEAQAKEMLSGVRILKSKVGHEGIKAFVLPVEEVS
ncbi:MAG: PG0541 family transporter-associated protein [Candidatus Omnitrophota bacterium]|jgi:nitrogen regulatory protein PII